MGIFRNLVGQKFGRLLVLARSKNIGTRTQWLCRCDCGKEKVIQMSSLVNHLTASCGCYNRESAVRRGTKHGFANTKLYMVWQSMLKRCRNPNDIHYALYGRRGINVSEEFKDFLTFKKHIEELVRPEGRRLSIDRIDNLKGYERGNLRWASQKQQILNSRKVRLYTFDGRTQCHTDWAREFGVNNHTIKKHIENGTFIVWANGKKVGMVNPAFRCGSWRN